MSQIHPFNPSIAAPLSDGFDSPFCNRPAAYAQQAALQLQQHLESYSWQGHDFFAPGAGRMFAVLVVRQADGKLACLYGFSGAVAEQWQWPSFVPPAFDLQHVQSFLPALEAELAQLQAQICAEQNDANYLHAKQVLAEHSQLLSEQTAALQAELVQRKALRRQAREQADAEQLVQLQAEGEADARRRAEDKRSVRASLQQLRQPVDQVERRLELLRNQHQSLSEHAQQRLMQAYRLPNARGELADVQQLFAGRMPLSGVGDCAGPKMLAFAYENNLTPLSMAEFWWGAEPVDQVRHHRHFYPSCRGRCGPLLTFMLQGLPAGRQPDHLQPFADPLAPEIVHEDKHLILVNKAADLLSVPGLVMTDSVQSRMQARHPDMPELQLVHRLDQSTSGLLLIAKTRRDHKALQRQFTARSIRKQYIALLEGCVEGERGEINLPLRVDLEDRPRQLVCHQHGKPALTRWQVLDRQADVTRVALSPVTGRTHQLRVHMAHAHGLAHPIVGDELYGRAGARLHLHAESLSFIHPGSGGQVSFQVPAPF